jgi:hypothetical protein
VLQDAARRVVRVHPEQERFAGFLSGKPGLIVSRAGYFTAKYAIFLKK